MIMLNWSIIVDKLTIFSDNGLNIQDTIHVTCDILMSKLWEKQNKQQILYSIYDIHYNCLLFDKNFVTITWIITLVLINVPLD